MFNPRSFVRIVQLRVQNVQTNTGLFLSLTLIQDKSV
jgi:hypothetical protein